MRALVRKIPESFVHALAAVPPDPPIDLLRAREQHVAYVETLGGLGASIVALDADETCPDCVFVEDTAVIARGVALVTRSAAASRRPEADAVATALAPYVDVVRMREPATLDGGDCMRLGSTFFVGRSARTNAEGIAQLESVLGGRVVVVEMPRHVLHLKCICSPLGDDRVLLAAETLPPSVFAGFDVLTIPAEEAYAANAVALERGVIVADDHPRTSEILAAAGFDVRPVPTSEVRKADGSLTCQSILF